MNELQLFASIYTEYHDNLTREDKDIILDFINESDDDKIYFLLSTGNMIQDEMISEGANDIAKALDFPIYTQKQFEDGITAGMRIMDPHLRAANLGQNTALTMGIYTGATGIAAAAGLSVIAIAIYRRYLSKSARSCKGKSGQERTSCINKFKRDAMKARISFLVKHQPNCKKTKDPEKCAYKVSREIRKLKTKLGTL